MASGVATRPIADFDAYQERLNRFVFRSGFIMKPVFTQAKVAPKRVVYAEGEDERILRATQVVVEEGLAQPILVGRPAVIETRLKRLGLAIRPGKDFDLINPEDDPRYRAYVQTHVEAAGRHGITPDVARTLVRTNNTVIAALAVRRGEADAMMCGVEGRYMRHLDHIRDIVGLCPGIGEFAAMSLLITSKGNFFLADTQVQPDPTAEEIARMAVLAAAHVRRFGLEPKIALLSHSDFGSYDSASARKMRRALDLVTAAHPELEIDGEMHADYGAASVPSRAGLSAFAPRRRGERADHAHSRCRQHCRRVDPRGRRRAAGRADPDRPGAPGAHSDALGHGARRRQHDGGRRRGGAGGGRGAVETAGLMGLGGSR